MKHVTVSVLYALSCDHCDIVLSALQVFLSLVTGLPGFGDKPAEVAVKQLRCK